MDGLLNGIFEHADVAPDVASATSAASPAQTSQSRPPDVRKLCFENEEHGNSCWTSRVFRSLALRRHAGLR